jgi:signal transduction histidine kinase
MTALAVSILAGVLASAAIAVRVSSPSTGTTIVSSPPGYGPDGVTIGRLPESTTALRDGDVVVAIAGRSTAAWASGLFGGETNRLQAALGDDVDFGLDRGGAPVDLEVPLVAYPTLAVLGAAWGTLTFVVALFLAGALVFWRRPTVPAAGALLLAGVGALGSTISYLLGQDPLDLATGSFVLPWFATTVIYLLLWAGLLDFALVFPRPLGNVARRPLVRLLPYLVVFGSYAVGLVAVTAGSAGTLTRLGDSLALTLLPSAICLIGGPILYAARWWRGPREDRPILRGFAYVTGFITVANLAIWVVPESIGGQPLVPWTVSGLIGLPFPILIGASILRHRAFEIDVVVRRSLVYGGLTVSVIVIYAIVATALGAVPGTSTPFATSLLATGVAAIAALPIRDGLQRAATRLVYGDRDEPVRAIRRLGERLELSVDPETMPRVVVDTVADALRLPYVGLELGTPPASRLVAERGTRPDDVVERPLAYQTRPIGRLIVGTRGPADPLTNADLSLLEDLARQIGVAAHAAGLTEDLRLSRERIVTAREEERRRLRRDLHDGLGPALAAIGMRAEAVENLIDVDPREARRLLADLRTEVTAAVGDVRRVVDALRPPAIDEVGLVGALRLVADRMEGPAGPSVSIEADGSFDDLPAAVEVAAYRIAAEAITNAVRHADATECRVRLTADDTVAVVVEDDGRGLLAARPEGIGLASMSERAAELGGDVRVEARPGGGTRVVARLPLGRNGRSAEP